MQMKRRDDSAWVRPDITPFVGPRTASVKEVM